jgi:molybdopterin-binding protein
VQARKFGENIFFMDNGKITQQGTVETIFSKPIDSTIAEYTFSENIFRGKIIEENKEKFFLCNGVKITVVADNPIDNVIAILRAEDIFVSKTIFESSARNSFNGIIKKIENIGNVYALTIDVKGLDFETVITRQSLYTMELKVKDNVYITFKATSVHIIN